MTDTASTETASHHDDHGADETPLFSAVEVEQFSADDVQAGGAIGKMLSALFLYTVIAMGISSWWTYSSIMSDKASASDSHSSDQAHEHEHEQPEEPGEKPADQ